ncbi:MAG: hypothetical protein AB8I80_14685 [Anaerolineae bacterium]
MPNPLLWAIGPDLSREKLTLLVFCMVGMQIVAANLAWRLGLRRTLAGRGLIWLARTCVYAGIPIAVLWRGALVTSIGVPTTYVEQGPLELALQLLGIGEPEGLLSVGRGVAVVIVLLALQIGLWVWYARTAPVPPDASAALSWWAALGEAFVVQLYWAFLRGIAGLYPAEGVYVALAGFALAVLPWPFDPWRRNELATTRGYRVVQDYIVVLCTAVLVLSADVLWLLILAHALWLWVGGRVVARLGALDRATRGEPVAEL